jgi:hypothetical protein
MVDGEGGTDVPITGGWRLVNWLDGIACWLSLLGGIYHPVPTKSVAHPAGAWPETTKGR